MHALDLPWPSDMVLLTCAGADVALSKFGDPGRDRVRKGAENKSGRLKLLLTNHFSAWLIPAPDRVIGDLR